MGWRLGYKRVMSILYGTQFNIFFCKTFNVINISCLFFIFCRMYINSWSKFKYEIKNYIVQRSNYSYLNFTHFFYIVCYFFLYIRNQNQIYTIIHISEYILRYVWKYIIMSVSCEYFMIIIFLLYYWYQVNVYSKIKILILRRITQGRWKYKIGRYCLSI